MRRIAITVEYMGTAYCGWQRQKNGLSVQQAMADAFFKLTGEKVTLHGSGRTDAGVHALGQVVHFDTNTTIPTHKLPFAWNTVLPSDIRVLDAKEVDENFHARFSVKRKTYQYRFYFSPHASALRKDFACHFTQEENFEEMKKAAKHFEGTFDFKGFQATGGHVKTTVRTIYSATLEKEGNEYVFEVCGNGFLYNMVRIIAGTIVYVGIGKLKADDIPDVIASGDRKRAGKTLPAYGLYLKKAEY